LYKINSGPISVEIYDQRYSLVLMAPMQQSDVEDLAEEVDRRMREVASFANTPDSLKIAVLTALHLAQELRELKKTSDCREADLCRKTDQWSHALEELLSH
jgi:cell division protein ZapA